MRTFRSLLLPLKAVVLNLVSLAAVFGSVVFFWQEGHGSDAVFGVAATGAITFWLPVVIFAFLFGLSMDYEVFILARMREEYDRTGDTATAVITGIGRTGRLVTSAALILFFAFAALASVAGHRHQGPRHGARASASSSTPPSSAHCWCPALVSLFGRWNWWLPGWLARVLRVEPSPLRPTYLPGVDPDPEKVPAGVAYAPAGSPRPSVEGTRHDEAHLATIRRVSCSSTTPSSSTTCGDRPQ